MIDGVILDAQCETHEVLACRPVPSLEEAYALIGVAFEILKDGPRYDEAGERIPLVSCRLPEGWGYPLGWLGTEIGGTVYSWGIDVACRLGAGRADVPPRLQKSFVTKDFS